MKKIVSKIDMKQVVVFLMVITGLFSTAVFAQEKVKELTPGEKILAEGESLKAFDKKFRWGISWNQYWGTIKGTDLTEEYFAKPCMGFNLRTEYYPLSFIGIGVGAGIQMRGAGIINEDKTGGGPFTHPWEPNYDPNDADSTYRERLRFNTFEVPVTILLRTPNDILKGVRLTGAAGLVFVSNYYKVDFFHAPEDGFHTRKNVSDEYIETDLAYQLSAGVDIDASESCVLQVHLVYTKGTKNVYANNQGDGRVQTFGFRVAWLF
jgi:hypothetical protein